MTYIITKIEPQKKHRNRFSLYSNNEFLAGVSSDTLLAYDLYAGKTLNDSDLAAIKDQEQRVAVSAAAARYLARRPHSARELRDKLLHKNFPPSIIDEILKNFKVKGYLNDREYARLLIAEEKRLRGSGPRAIRNKLLSRGVKREICDELLADLYSESEQRAQCTKLAEKKQRTLKNQSRKEKKQRLAAYLSGKGFDWDTIYSVIGNILSEDDHETE